MTSDGGTPEPSKNEETRYRYDVFLSFRGEDTRKNFVDHLYNALRQRGIKTFRDDSEHDLQRGKSIWPELMRAIEESRFVLVIFSENYASSTWCLDELAKIVECKGTGAGLVIPIFYKINPSDIRKINGNIQRDFAKHEEKFKDDTQKLEKWRAALTEVASLSGRELSGEYESQFIQKIVREIEDRLGPRFPFAAPHLVGMRSRIADIIYHLHFSENDVRSIGICGMPGVGKTTLARAVYDSIHDQFEGCSFLANVREVSDKNGLTYLQNQLLRDVLQVDSLDVIDVQRGARMIEKRLRCKKVVVILDDVDHKKQLEYLAGDLSWFGQGSRIIITTRDEHLLYLHGVKGKYRAEKLIGKEALELFCWKAFKSTYPRKGFEGLSKLVIGYCDGLPLAIDVLGSYLCGRDLGQWQSALARLEDCPKGEIFNQLRISYDKLEEKEKQIFLDIACFFKGRDKGYVMEIMDSCGFYPEIGIEVLTERSLITTENEILWMHDLLQEMAWQIVRETSPQEPGKRSRVWLFEDLHHILTYNSGTDKLEGIVLHSGDERDLNANGESFTNMINLRLLDIHAIRLSSGIKHLSNNLRILTWDKCNLKSFPPNFYPQNLLELNMRDSLLKKLWRGEKVFQKLKVINLSGSELLVETPNFIHVPNLERLILKGCKRLYKVHSSIGYLDKLTTLDLSECENLMRLPESAGNLKSLQVLNLSGCLNLEELPENINGLECLEELDISETVITNLPSSLTFLKNLKILRLHGWKRPTPMYLWKLMCTTRNILDLWRLMHTTRNILNSRDARFPSFSGLSSLMKLDMSDCNLKEGQFPNGIHCLSSLTSLDLSRNDFTYVFKSINLISSLEILILNHCKNLEELPELSESIIFVEADKCVRLISISNPFIICSAPGDGFCFINCLCFLPQDLDLTLQQKYYLSLLRYTICLPLVLFSDTYVVYPNQCSVPEWFSFQGSGSLVGIDLPPHWFHPTWGGFMICAYFEEGSCYSKMDRDFLHFLSCRFLIGENQLGPLLNFPIRFVNSRCVWSSYVSRFEFPSNTDWKAMSSRIDVSFFITNPRLKIEKCGVHLVYGHDPNVFNEFLIGWADSTSRDCDSIYREFLQPPKYDIAASMTQLLIECGITGTSELENQVERCGVSIFEPGPEMPGGREVAEVVYVFLKPQRLQLASDSIGFASVVERGFMEAMAWAQRLLKEQSLRYGNSTGEEKLEDVITEIRDRFAKTVKSRRSPLTLQQLQQLEAQQLEKSFGTHGAPQDYPRIFPASATRKSRAQSNRIPGMKNQPREYKGGLHTGFS